MQFANRYMLIATFMRYLQNHVVYNNPVKITERSYSFPLFSLIPFIAGKLFSYVRSSWRGYLQIETYLLCAAVWQLFSAVVSHYT